MMRLRACKRYTCGTRNDSNNGFKRRKNREEISRNPIIFDWLAN